MHTFLVLGVIHLSSLCCSEGVGGTGIELYCVFDKTKCIVHAVYLLALVHCSNYHFSTYCIMSDNNFFFNDGDADNNQTKDSFENVVCNLSSIILSQVEFLCERGADVNRGQRSSSLHYAACFGRPQVAKVNNSWLICSANSVFSVST